jgi:hypothetical protein
MRNWVAIFVTFLVIIAGSHTASAEDMLDLAVEAAKQSTLDQPGTYPFHLRATVAPSRERDLASNRTGEIEIWWKSPGQYRRELRAPGFHQVEIVSGERVWQKNHGKYMPEWLDAVARALLHPLPAESAAMHGEQPELAKTMAGSIYLNWEKPVPMDMQLSKQVVAITEATGLLFYDDGLGWGALFKDYANFHGREVPRTVEVGSPEVTAKIVLMEDLPSVPSRWFDTSASGGHRHPIVLIAVETTDLSTDLAKPPPALVWPDPPNTRASGVIWTDLVIDRKGHIREPFYTISDNPALNEFMHDYLAGLHFKPMIRDGQSVEVVRHVVLHFDLGKQAELKRFPVQ